AVWRVGVGPIEWAATQWPGSVERSANDLSQSHESGPALRVGELHAGPTALLIVDFERTPRIGQSAVATGLAARPGCAIVSHAIAIGPTHDRAIGHVHV